MYSEIILSLVVAIAITSAFYYRQKDQLPTGFHITTLKYYSKILATTFLGSLLILYIMSSHFEFDVRDYLGMGTLFAITSSSTTTPSSSSSSSTQVGGDSNDADENESTAPAPAPASAPATSSDNEDTQQRQLRMSSSSKRERVMEGTHSDSEMNHRFRNERNKSRIREQKIRSVIDDVGY